MAKQVKIGPSLVHGCWFERMTGLRLENLQNHDTIPVVISCAVTVSRNYLEGKAVTVLSFFGLHLDREGRSCLEVPCSGLMSHDIPMSATNLAHRFVSCDIAESHCTLAWEALLPQSQLWTVSSRIFKLIIAENQSVDLCHVTCSRRLWFLLGSMQ